MRSRALESFAKILPVLLLVTSILGLLIGGIAFGRWDYSVRGLIVAVPSIIASLFLVYMMKIPMVNNDGSNINIFNIKSFSISIFVILYLLSIIVLLAGFSRVVYFIIISALYVLIFAQIFSQKTCSNGIVAEIMLVMINIIYSTTLGYPLFYRTTDVLVHATFSTVTRVSGHTIPIDLDPYYANFPLFHIFNAISSNILGLSSLDTHFLLMGPVYVIVVLFLYKIFLKISDNEQISLLACLCFSVSPIVLLRGIEMITSITAFFGFVFLLFLIFTTKQENSLTYKILILLVSLFIMLVHQVSIVQIVILIALLMACEFILVEKQYFSSNLILFIIISFISYWIFTSQIFLTKLVNERLNLNYLDFGGYAPVSEIPAMNQMDLAVSYLQEHIYMSIFIFFALIGIVYTLYRQKPQYFSVIALFSLLVFVLYIPNPLLTSQTIARVYRIDRFWILISPFMALVMASGIYWSCKFTQSQKKISYGLITLVLIIFILLSLQNPVLDITTNKGRLYFTEGELSGFGYVSQKVPYGSELYSDAATSRFFNLINFSLTRKFDLPYYKPDVLKTMANSPQNGQYVIFRDSKFKDGSIQFQTETERATYLYNYYSNEENVRKAEYFHEMNNIIYNNNQISVIA